MLEEVVPSKKGQVSPYPFTTFRMANKQHTAFTEADDDALYDLLTKYRGSLKRASQAPEARWSHNAVISGCRAFLLTTVQIRARIHYLRNVLKDPRFRGSFKQPRTNSEQALKNFYKVLKGHGRQRKEELLANERIVKFLVRCTILLFAYLV